MTLQWALAATVAAEKPWRQMMGTADMPKLVTALRGLDLARVSSSTARRAA